MDLVPHALKQISPTINTPRSSTTRFLSLSTSKCRPPSVINMIPSCCFIQATRVPCHHLSWLTCTFTYDALTLTLVCDPHLFFSLPINISHPPSVVDAVPLLHSVFACLCSHTHDWRSCPTSATPMCDTLTLTFICIHICTPMITPRLATFTWVHSHTHIWCLHWGSWMLNTGLHTRPGMSHSHSMLHQVFLTSMPHVWRIGGLDGYFIGAGWCSWCGFILSHFISFYFWPSLFFHDILWKLSCHWRPFLGCGVLVWPMSRYR